MRRAALDSLVLRWKVATRAMKVSDQKYGDRVIRMLEERTDAELARFEDPLEAALFFCMLELTKTRRSVMDAEPMFIRF
jgi:hypothetical protein